MHVEVFRGGVGWHVDPGEGKDGVIPLSNPEP